VALLVPMLRVEYRHDFQGDSNATMRYADLPAGPLYRVQAGSNAQDHTVTGVGLEARFNHGAACRIEYQQQFDNATTRDESILLDVRVPFG
ncbi:MAG: autotransporter domain-containing protein, partial [Alcanivorax sp.]|nr:autotransporter domain-containing protein [Alcanivorax sp.]